jgi:hypothetical protein
MIGAAAGSPEIRMTWRGAGLPAVRFPLLVQWLCYPWPLNCDLIAKEEVFP